MELKIVSSEIITPSPTPLHLRTHKLSILDQFSPDCFVPIIFFYSTTSNDTGKISDQLKKSLSRTLTRYYPFAGRIKDQFSVDCDDYGAPFIVARVAGQMSEILKRPNNDFLEKLVPFKLNGKPDLPVNLIVQVTYFSCGGMAICVGFSHIIADIETAANFIKFWAAIARGCSSIFGDLGEGISDFTSIFPPQDLSGLFSSTSLYECFFLSKENIVKRFVFDGDKIAALREKMGNESSSGYHPTRFEAVSALILGGLMTAAREKDEFHYTHLVAGMAVNLRKRMNPPLPEQSLGNIVQLTTAKWSMEKTIDYNKLAEKLHESISIINDDHVRKIHADGYLNYMKKASEGFFNNCIKQFTITSWLRQSFYDVDFGWGKPIWVSNATNSTDIAILIDSRDDKGIEALVGLPKNEMDKFEKDPGILAYASVDTSLL